MAGLTVEWGLREWKKIFLWEIKWILYSVWEETIFRIPNGYN